MARSIRAVLSPLLMVSYVCGLRIFEFPAGHPRPWFGISYNLLLWSVYSFFLLSDVVSHIPRYCVGYVICIWMRIFAALISTLFGMYHDKKFRHCLKKLAIVDDTLEQLGMITDYQKLRTRMLWVILGWSILIISMNCFDSLWWKDRYNVGRAIYISFMFNYSCYINIIDDLTFVGILVKIPRDFFRALVASNIWIVLAIDLSLLDIVIAVFIFSLNFNHTYIGLKFDQVNEYLHNLADTNWQIEKYTDYKRGIKRAWENIVLQPNRRKSLTAPSNECMTWIIIHLHLELCKISREINSMFGIQITIKMASCFIFIAEMFREIFYMLFVRHRIPATAIYTYITISILWLVLVVLKLILINYVCERVSAKANATRGFTNRVLCSTSNMEIRENIVQLWLQITRAPLRFCGIGFFQFGFKFLHGYFESVLTYLIILVQANKNAYKFLENYD